MASLSIPGPRFLVVVVAIYCSRSVLAGCPDEWTSYSGSCYSYINVPQTWAEAAEVCEKLRGHLVEISGKDENDFVKRFVKNRGVTTDVWIGGGDLVVNGTWRWLTSRERIDFYDWAPGEPKMTANMRCIQLWQAKHFMWDDTYCDLEQVFVCETGPLAGNVFG